MLSDLLFHGSEVADMKIHDINRLGAANQYKNQNTSRAKSNLAGSQRRDEVQISSEALEMLKSQAVEPGANKVRIEQLKQSVENGSYSVDSRKLAEKLLPYL
jgi:negative regulator of flagellin synthesis FlgM